MENLLLLTQIGGRTAAFRAEDISSIIEIGNVTPVPRSPTWVAGLGALRSRALTVIDARKALAIDEAPQETDPRAAVVEVEGHSYALLVDRVEDVVSGLGKAVPGAATLGPQWQRATQGMIETDVGPALLIDVARLVAGPHQKAA